MNALEFFAARLRFQTDVSDVHTALHDTPGDFVLIDSRDHTGWAQARIPGAVHMPHAEIPHRAPAAIDLATPVVTYCWGPGCNGATRAALAFARLGYQVTEMLGGIEYWIREGFPVDGPGGRTQQAADPLTAPTLASPTPTGAAHAVTCGC